MDRVATDAGLSLESLYKALSGERVPRSETVLRVVGALGLKLRAEVLDAEVLDAEAARVRQRTADLEWRRQGHVAGRGTRSGEEAVRQGGGQVVPPTAA